MRRIINTVLISLLLVLAAGATFIYSGRYNIAATTPHTPVFKRVVGVFVDRSVAYHARDIQVPADFPAMDARTGFSQFDQMCVGCHGAPGVAALDIAQQMNPKPPELGEEAGEWSPAQLYWIITHGIKMTGMPGIRELHNQQERWQLTAFVHSLPEMAAADYQAMRNAARADETPHRQH